MSQPADPDEPDRRFMAAAIELSKTHLGLTGENPSVGSLVVAPDGSVVGRGVTALGGRPHAEIRALAQAGAAARGSTVYATLEPCSHIGRAPPCADAIVAAGAARVVIATLDPDPRVAGRGVGILRAAGVEVVTGCLEKEARRVMEGFLSLKARGRPWLTLKLAVSADGRLGRAGAGQVAITGPVARRAVQDMRMQHEAIMVGVGTVVEDDPLLTVRLPGLEDRSPIRVVIDPFARMPSASRMLAPGLPARTIVLVSGKAPDPAVAQLYEAGAEFHVVGSDYRGRFEPREILRALGLLGIKSVLLEGGAGTARRFLDSGMVDRIALFGGRIEIGPDGVDSPVTPESVPPGYQPGLEVRFGEDLLLEYERKD